MVIVKATRTPKAGQRSSEQLLSAMAKFNEQMAKAGVMLDGNGMQPRSKGARVRISAMRSVIDGPFAETKELVAGYWILQCKSLAETIEWIKHAQSPSRARSAQLRAGDLAQRNRLSPRLGEQIADQR